jgi:uncharacterized protein DUF3987
MLNIASEKREQVAEHYERYAVEVAAIMAEALAHGWSEVEPCITSLVDLAAARRWVAWQEETRKGKLTKLPKNPATGNNARVPTDPSTYGTRAEAEARWQKIKKADPSGVGGIGIVLGELADGCYLLGSDLDSCRDAATGEIANWAKEVIDRFATYAEVSPSGTGVKLFFMMSAMDELHTLLGNNVEGKQLTRKTFAAGEHREIALDTARFYAVTGEHLNKATPIRLVPFADVEWFITEAGPNYLQLQRSGNGKNFFEARGDEQHGERDESGSGYGFRFMRDQCHPKRMSYEQAREAILADAEEAGEWANRVNERQLKRAWERTKSADQEKREWPTLAPEALYGLPGEVVALYEPHTEADPVALLIQFLVSFGNALDRGPYFLIEDTEHYTNLFTVLVGKTSKSRKGTSGDRVRRLMTCVAPVWVNECITGGLASGEGAIWAIRDKEKEKEDGNVNFFSEPDDKRLLFDEREFSKVLAVMQREGSTVSQVVRNAWDGHNLSIVTKNNPIRATKPMISVVGHITEDELRSMLDVISIANGYANRFLFVCVRRSKLLPRGGNLDRSAIEVLGAKIKAVYDRWYMTERRIKMDAQADALWDKVYAELSDEQPGLFGAITGRAEAQTIRLALLYALLDGSEQIKVAHLRAGLALWKYCADSARYVFGDSLGDLLCDDLLRALRNSGGMSRTQIRDHFKRNKDSGKIDTALATLKKHGRVNCEMRATGARGPKAEFWVPT